MTTSVDTETGTTERRSTAGFLKPASERPLLLAASALLLFACCLIAGVLLMSSDPIKAVVEVVRLDLDQDASGPASLVRIAPLSIDAERSAILSDDLIEDALKKAGGPPSSPPATDGRGNDALARALAVLDSLEVNATARINELEISLPATIADDQEAIVNSIAARYVELRNQERKQQKEQALGWADRKLAYWQGAIGILKSDLTSDDAAGPEQATLPNAAAAGAETDRQKLLDFLLEATRTAQADTLSKIRNTFGVTDDGRRERSINVLEQDYAKLGQDLERLEAVPSEAGETKPAAPAEKSSNLKSTEEKLTLFKRDLDALISSGLLESPAAKVIAPALAPPLSARLPWAVLIPAAAALSLILALLLTSALVRWWPLARSALADDQSAGDEVLTNPYWPMTPQQHFEEMDR